MSRVIAIKSPEDEWKLLKQCSLDQPDLQLIEGAKILGAGGNARIYQANWKDNLVAVKIAPSNEGIAADKLREAPHPNIITTHAYIRFNENEGCLVMEKIVGNAISALTDSDDDSEFRKQWCKAGFETRKCVDIVKRVMTQILEGVQFMHQNGVVHRDLKPENIMLVAPHDEFSFKNLDLANVKVEDFNAKILDFGLSVSALPERRHIYPTGTGGYIAPEAFLSGIPGYIPEKKRATYKGSIEVDLRKADMFSVGRVFGNLITLKNFTFNAAARGMELKFKLQNGNLNEEVWNNTFHCSESFCEGTWCDVHVQEVCKIVQGLQKVVPEERMTSATALKLLNPAKDVVGSPARKNMLRSHNSRSRLSPRLS